MSRFVVCTVFLCFSLFACTAMGPVDSDSKPVSHQQWDALLKKHVQPNGKVNYQGFIQDSLALNAYLKLLKSNHPNAENWSTNQQLAYWINAYNAFTIQLMIRHYPVQSIKDIKNGIPFVNTVWDIKFIKIEGERYDLNNIEHGIIRKQFNEPRIHFAVNCASRSCPRLRNEAYVAQRLDEQLDDQADYFINTSGKNNISGNNAAQLSKLFKWFSGDFSDKHGSVINFLNRYSKVKLDSKAELSYFEYDWRINE